MRSTLSFAAGLVVGLAIVGVALLLAPHLDGSPDSVPSASATLNADAAADLAASTEPAGKRGQWPRTTATSYEMRSAAGNRAVRGVVDHAAKMLKRGHSREAVLRVVKAEFDVVSRRFGEAWETTVCEATAAELDRWLEAAGEEPIDACTEFQG